jgi:hypothetical protein
MNNLLNEYIQSIKKEFKAIFPNIVLTIKVKKIKRKNCIAVYRSGTAILNKSAIIWISEDFIAKILEIEGETDPFFCQDSIYQNLKDTIAHELIHIIQELNHFKEKNMIIGCNFNELEAERLGVLLSNNKDISKEPLINNYLMS